MKAFTLVELLIVVAILGILAMAAITAISPAKRQNQAKDAKIKADIDQLTVSLQAYFTTHQPQTLPLTLTELVNNKDLKSLPTPPGGGYYQSGYSAVAEDGGTCDGSTAVCARAKLSWALTDPSLAGKVWCWQSQAGKAEVMEAAACTL